MGFIHHLINIVESCSYIDSTARNHIRNEICNIEVDDAKEALKKLVDLVVSEKVDWCEGEIRLRLKNALEHGSIIDELCDRISLSLIHI